jgi:hypothetical protein
MVLLDICKRDSLELIFLILQAGLALIIPRNWNSFKKSRSWHPHFALDTGLK